MLWDKGGNHEYIKRIISTSEKAEESVLVRGVLQATIELMAGRVAEGVLMAKLINYPYSAVGSSIKSIVSIGGWGFSPDPSTYKIFRKAVTSEANCQTLIKNIINFLNDYDLDGVDWDWEYPEEPDIPGIPAGSEEETTGYFLLLSELKNKMPAGKTVSITAPASYWYLQHFPIQALSLVVDYIVYMTYDLHGQWDYKNKYGTALRSHVNLTETINSLSMITKAGVPSNMIVGVSSYGRSFRMSPPAVGQNSVLISDLTGAYPGHCTNT
ncbi:hypothetical protein FQN49_003467, partial [Arthroderma sp. PD_2]